MIENSRYIGIRLSEEEDRRIREQAEMSHLTISEFMRRRALGKQIVPKSDLGILSELRRLGGLLKHVHLETRGSYSELTANAIRALEAYGRKLERSYEERNGGSDLRDRQNSTQEERREE
jgi:hypothetical protein